MSKESAILRAEGLIAEAALSLVSWDDAMAAFASATGSRTGQLIGFASSGRMLYNVMTGVDPASLDEFVASGGTDPSINSRVRVGIGKGQMEVFDSASLTPEQDAERSPEFANWIDKYSMGYCRLLNFVKQGRSLVGGGVIRDFSEGGMSSGDRRAFDYLAMALHNAVSAQLAIEAEQEQIVAHSFEAMGRPVLICGCDGQLASKSPSADRMLAQGRFLRCVEGRIVTSQPRFDAAFRARLAQTCLAEIDGSPVQNAMVIHDVEGVPLLVRFQPFPRPEKLRLRAAVLVIPVVMEPRERQVTDALRDLFDLTATESLVAAQVAHGRSPANVATLLNVQTSTIRSHLKRIFQKTGCQSQVELAVLVGRLG